MNPGLSFGDRYGSDDPRVVGSNERERTRILATLATRTQPRLPLAFDAGVSGVRSLSVIATGGLNHIHLNVADVERSVLFYQRVFGATEAFRVGDNMVFLQLPGTEDVITLHQSGGPPAIEHFGLLRTEGVDLDSAIAEIESAGGRLIERGEHAPTVAYAYVADPDGYTIEL